MLGKWDSIEDDALSVITAYKNILKQLLDIKYECFLKNQPTGFSLINIT